MRNRGESSSDGLNYGGHDDSDEVVVVDSDEEEISAKEMAEKLLQMNPSRAGQVKRKRNQYISREEDDD